MPRKGAEFCTVLTEWSSRVSELVFREDLKLLGVRLRQSRDRRSSEWRLWTSRIFSQHRRMSEVAQPTKTYFYFILITSNNNTILTFKQCTILVTLFENRLRNITWLSRVPEMKYLTSSNNSARTAIVWE